MRWLLFLMFVVVSVGQSRVAYPHANDILTLAYDGLCKQITRYTDLILDGTDSIAVQTRCEAVTDGRQAILALVAQKPVFSVVATRRAWGLIALMAAGKVLRDHLDLPVSYISLSDLQLIKDRKAVVVRAKRVEDLQRRIHNGEVSSDEAAAILDATLSQPISVPMH